MKTGGLNWKDFYKDGKAYFDRLVAGSKSGYTPEVLHGLASMASEKLLMSLLLYNARIPQGHTFADLVAESAEICEIDDDLSRLLLRIDDMVPLCSLDPAKSWRIDPALVPDLITAARRTKELVDAALGDLAAAGI